MSGNGDRAYLGRDAIFALADRPHEVLPMPDWGPEARVLIGTWSLATQWRIAEASLDPAQRGRMLALVVALSVVNEAGARVFSDEDAVRLAEDKSYRALKRIADAAMRWNGLTAEVVDDLGKASESVPTAASPSGSPPPSG